MIQRGEERLAGLLGYSGMWPLDEHMATHSKGLIDPVRGRAEANASRPKSSQREPVTDGVPKKT